ncbi:hypothetical protein [Thermococcus sp. GR6]|uniref:hypothetical protein n=1 Tax=Thermococcus sp. GR6 TaxID=1638256 RepID=UPI001431A547|nr:hypothetical protein [Thermococcus sp. GR6]NJE41636.1 hypothetical protein [Thermococcus sp. GR6]
MDALKNVLAFVIVALVILSLFSSYIGYETEKKTKSAISHLEMISELNLLCLSEVSSLRTMLDGNASDDVIKERVRLYESCAITLQRSAFGLYSLTGDDKYYTLGVFAANLESFFHTLYTHPDRLKESLEKNMNILNSISVVIEGFIEQARQVDELTLQDVETLENLSKRLSY